MPRIPLNFVKHMKNLQEIRGIVFDLGGVLMPVDKFYQTFFKKVSRMLGIPQKKMESAVVKELLKLEIGLIGNQDFWRNIYGTLQIRDLKKRRAMKALWLGCITRYIGADKRLLPMVHKLHKKYRLGIISNTYQYHADALRRKGLFNFFSVVVLSYKVHLRKPQKKIFLLAAKRLRIPPGNLIFIDDNMKYVDIAERAGFQAVRFASVNQLRRELQKLGLKSA